MGGSHSTEEKEETEELDPSTLPELQEKLKIGELAISPRTKEQIESEITSPRTKVSILKKILTLRSIPEVNNKTPRLIRYCSFVELPEINLSELTVYDTIGWGSTGVIKRGSWKGKEVAAKLLFPHSDPNKFRQELRHWCAIRHKNIVEVYAACTNVNNMCIVMEYMKDGSLADYLREIDTQLPEAWPSLYYITLDIVRAMIHLHSSANRIHRDLKPANILLSKDGDRIVAKLCDFGECRSTAKIMTPKVGTVSYMAPELISGEQYSSKVDVYSFGMLLWEMISREEPYSDIHFIHEIIEKVNEGVRPKIPKHCPSMITSLINDCWNQEPNLRPNFTDILMRLLHIGKMWDQFEVGSVLSTSDITSSTSSILSVSRSSYNLQDQLSSITTSQNSGEIQRPSRRKNSKVLKKALSVHSLPKSYRKAQSTNDLFQSIPLDSPHSNNDSSAVPIQGNDEEDDDNSYDESDDESILYENDDRPNVETLSMNLVDINLDDNDEDDAEHSAPVITITPNIQVPQSNIHNERYKLLSHRKKNLHSLLFSDSDLALIRRHRFNPRQNNNLAPESAVNDSTSLDQLNNNTPQSSSKPPLMKSNAFVVNTGDLTPAYKSRSYTVDQHPMNSIIHKNEKRDDDDADQLLIQILKIALKRESEKVKQLKESNDFLRKKYEQQKNLSIQLQHKLQTQQFSLPIDLTQVNSAFSSSCISLHEESNEKTARKDDVGLEDARQFQQFLIETNKKALFSQSNQAMDNLSVEINFSDIQPSNSPFFYSSYSIWYVATYFNISVKFCIVICGINADKLQSFRQNAAKIQRITNHPNMVSIIGVVTKQPNFCIVYQNNENYSELSNLISHKKQLSINDKFQILKNIAYTIEYCHKHDVIIGQFNPRSIFINNHNHHKIKLLHECNIINYGKKKDFSWSKYRWLSPELMKSDSSFSSSEIQFTQQSDIYTFGLIIWYILAEEEPFHTLDAQEVAMKLETSNYKIDVPKSWPSVISDLLNTCWKLDPMKRPTISDMTKSFSSIIENIKESWIFPSPEEYL